MGANIITVFNQKGGAGKTTVSVHLAVGLARRGFKVALVDTDEQASAMTWAAQAAEERPFPVTVIGLSHMGAVTHRELRKHLDNYEFIVVDCPPALNSPIPKSAMLVADLAIIPMKASPLDIWAAEPARQLAHDVRSINEHLTVRVLVNEAQQTTLKKGALEMLSADADAPPMRTAIALRNGYRACAMDGATVFDLLEQAKDKKTIKAMQPAVDEMEALVGEVLELLQQPLTASQDRKVANG